MPAIFLGLYVDGGEHGPLYAVNVMGLSSPESAILSAVIFNAVIIIGLIPLALRGVTYHAQSASQALRRNLIVYGVGGVVTPFVGIKLIDLAIVSLGIV